MEQFIYNLKISEKIKPNVFNEIHFKVIVNFFKALVFIIPACYFIYKLHLDDKPEDFLEYHEKLIEKKKTQYYIQIIQGVVFILLSIRYFFFYKPTNSELSTSILIKYLKKKNILSQEIYNILKNYKPYNITNYV